MSFNIISSPTMIEEDDNDDLISLGSIFSEIFSDDIDIITDNVKHDDLSMVEKRLPPTTATTTTTTMTKHQCPPRMVSVESMSQVYTSTPSLSSSRTRPLDSLKQLVSKKQQQQNPSSCFLKRSASLTLSGNNKLSSVFQKPSDFLRQAIQKRTSSNTNVPVAKKKRRTTTTTTANITKSRESSHIISPSALHEACRRGPELTLNELETILYKDPTAASRPVQLMTTKQVYNPVSCRLDNKMIPEPYMYPLNLAISYQASSVVLERLVSAAPHVLNLPDNKSRSLHILLRHKPTDSRSADMMLLKQPMTSSWSDSKQQNSALHIAVCHGSCLQTVRHLVALHPDALLQRNFHGQTPLDLAQRQGIICSTDVATYLWNQVQEQF